MLWRECEWKPVGPAFSEMCKLSQLKAVIARNLLGIKAGPSCVAQVPLRALYDGKADCIRGI